MFENDKDLVKGVHGVHGVKGGMRYMGCMGDMGVRSLFTFHYSPSSLLSGGRRRCLLP